MYEYNFNDIRKTIEEILDKSLTKSKEAYYNQLEIFKKDQDDNESLKDVKVKKKKIIMKDPSNGQANIEKEVFRPCLLSFQISSNLLISDCK